MNVSWIADPSAFERSRVAADAFACPEVAVMAAD
jgi:hypothetical protein